MSSSESEDFDQKPAGKQLFVQLLSEHVVVFEKSRVPKVVQKKKEAWEVITEEYSNGIGKKFTVAQLNKLLTNMKSHIKKKTDLKATGNKPIKLKDWEKDLLLLLSQEGNPVFKKVPGATSVGGKPQSTGIEDLDDGVSSSPPVTSPSTIQATTSTYVRPAAKTVALHEAEGTKELSLPQLQRVVLLKQLELQKLQIEREKRELEKYKGTEKSTQTDCK